jgi:hypothetical protein
MLQQTLGNPTQKKKKKKTEGKKMKIKCWCRAHERKKMKKQIASIQVVYRASQLPSQHARLNDPDVSVYSTFIRGTRCGTDGGAGLYKAFLDQVERPPRGVWSAPMMD